MASNLTDVVLSAPTVDPDIDVGQDFTMTIYGVYAGGGGASTHSLWLEWDQGSDSWQAIPTTDTGAGLWSTDGATAFVDTTTLYDSGNPISRLIRGNKAGVYKIRAHGYRAAVGDVYDPDATPWFTVTVNAVGGALTINVSDGLGGSEALD